MKIIQELDLQMVSFVVMSLVQEYWLNIRLPQIQYWEWNLDSLSDDSNKKIS